MFVHVLVQTDAPLTQPLTYRAPDGMPLAIGDAVVVPLGAQQIVGSVVDLDVACPPSLEAKIRPVAARVENAALFDARGLALARWVASQTLCSLRDAVRLIAPEVLTSQIRTTIRLCAEWEQALNGTRSQAQRDVATALASLGGAAEPARLVKSLEGAKIGPALAELRRKGVVREERTLSLPPARRKVVRVLRLAIEADVAGAEADRLGRGGSPKQARLLRALAQEQEAGHSVPVSGLAVGASAAGAAKALADKGLATYVEAPARRDPFAFFGFVERAAPALTDAQALAAQAIGTHLRAQDGRTLLLHGVTGSGKTEVYLDAVAQTLALGKSALVLLPEIGLTAQVLDLFKARFGEDEVAVLHSALSLGERHDEWRRIKTGAARVVVGARSAVFAPVPVPGLVILDEEHDASYKQDSNPRYHARDAAQFLATLTGATVVLGSATPSLESYYKAQMGEYGLLTLAERISERPLPPVQIVDLRDEMKPPAPVRDPTAPLGTPKPEKPPPSVLGAALLEAMKQRLARREQMILFLNRRGFASFLLCRDCGFTFQCPHCDVSLTYHHAAAFLQCHYCDFRRRAPSVCPSCGGLRLRPFGLGTERVEQAVAQHFPHARTLRMDRDTMTRKGAHAETLRAFRRHEADVLVGTQMIAKGLDFPNVTLVGVVSADTALHIPDFRAPERAFQLLTQVAGRAGRGELRGNVIIQTFTPEHDSVQRAARHDYEGFFAEAIAQRKELGYPPFSHMANAVFADEDEALAQGRAQALADALARALEQERAQGQILGPVACPFACAANIAGIWPCGVRKKTHCCSFCAPLWTHSRLQSAAACRLILTRCPCYNQSQTHPFQRRGYDPYGEARRQADRLDPQGRPDCQIRGRRRAGAAPSVPSRAESDG